MWNPLDTIVFIVGSMIAAIIIVTLLGSGPGGWLILLGLIALLIVMTPAQLRWQKEEVARRASWEAFLEAERRRERGEA